MKFIHAYRPPKDQPSKRIHELGTCEVTGKITFASRSDAKHRRNMMMAKGVTKHEVRPFKCVHCDLFHLGNPETNIGLAPRDVHRFIARNKAY